MTKEMLIEEVEGIIDALLEELGDDTRDVVIEPAMINVIYGFYADKFTIEDVYEASKYLEFPVDIEQIVLEKVARQKRKEQRAKARKKAKKGAK